MLTAALTVQYFQPCLDQQQQDFKCINLKKDNNITQLQTSYFYFHLFIFMELAMQNLHFSEWCFDKPNPHVILIPGSLEYIHRNSHCIFLGTF